MSGEGSGGSGSDSGSAQGLNHGPGSFAHNNADHLPGGRSSVPDTGRPLTQDFNRTDPMRAAQVADQGKTEAERRQPQVTSQERAFRASRTRHAPEQAPTLRPTNSGPTDRASFNARQNQEFVAARNDQNTATLEARAGRRTFSGAQTPEEKFRLSRDFKARSQGQARKPDQGR